VGCNVGTATWNRRDDPSMVPRMGAHEDLSDFLELDLVGGRSFFPHMSNNWAGTVKE
jgi:hypothetical protein